MASISHLPPELISHIFALTCDLDTSIFFLGAAADISDAANYPSLVLSHVCPRWRSFLLACPKAWSRVTVRENLSTITCQKVSKIGEIVNMYLTRSGTLPVDFVIEFPELTACDPSSYEAQSLELSAPMYHLLESFLQIYRLFFQHATRWKKAYLTLNVGILKNRHASGWPNTFPVLEELEVRVLGLQDDRSDTAPKLEIVSAPVLRTLVHRGVLVYLATDRGEMLDPLPSLELLTLSEAFYSKNLSLACANTSVTLFAINGIARAPRNACLARNLRIDVLPTWGGERTLDYICSSLDLPHITHLRAESLPNDSVISGPYGIRLPSEFVGLISDPTRSSASTSLTHLTLVSVLVWPTTLVSVLSHIPALTHFAFGEFAGEYAWVYEADDDHDEDDTRIAMPPLTPAFFESLTFSSLNGTRTRLLPNLQVLHLAFGFGSGAAGSAFTLTGSKSEALLNVLNSRLIDSGLENEDDQASENGVCLHTVRLILPALSRREVEDEEEGVVYWMDELSSGMKLDCTLEWAGTREDWRRLGLGDWTDEE
ncbi:hypothetical protein VKT23_015491 [Stygiomarasmius scandens]|uniref:F-box domain-containing protein n=1 Tax=Marasmiellus scandens TaxID=2682957 RepID=A0ABR1J051_9AGAR